MAYWHPMASLLADVAEALGLTERTVGAALNRANLADVVFDLSLRFKLPIRRCCELAGVSEAELATAATRAHTHHRREMVEQSRVARDRQNGVVRKKHAPIGVAPHPGWRWCRRKHHWVDPDDMTRNSSQSSGFGTWCKECFREYWAEQKKTKKAAAALAAKVAQ